jgi:hypothetical protein
LCGWLISSPRNAWRPAGLVAQALFAHDDENEDDQMTAAFDPEATEAMMEAYDRACRSMHDWGQPVIIREIIAKRIIQLAARGEQDPDQLCEQALRSLGFSESPSLQPSDRCGD